MKVLPALNETLVLHEEKPTGRLNKDGSTAHLVIRLIFAKEVNQLLSNSVSMLNVIFPDRHYVALILEFD